MFLKKKRSNLSKMRPVLKERFTLEPLGGHQESGSFRCRLLISRDSWLERLSVRWLKQPQTIQVKLDPLGSFVLSHCDGKRTVEEIAKDWPKHSGKRQSRFCPGW